MVNRGVAPLDPTSEVGQFRLQYGDTSYQEFDPPEPGYGDYDELSDTEIEQFLAQGDGSIFRSIGYLYLAMAGHAAKEAVSTQDYDLKLDATKRSGELRAVAKEFFDLADSEDDTAGLGDILEVFSMGEDHHCGVELMMPPIRGRYLC